MIAKEKVIALAEERIQELNNDNYLVQVTVTNKNQIKVVMDNLHRGVSIKDCMSVSRNIEHNLDRSLEDFQLEVTSPGLDQPFFVEQQYIKNIGNLVNVLLINGKRKSGKILSYKDNKLRIEIIKKQKRTKKDNIIEEIIIPENEIKETKLKIKWK